jgi:hypothetical protein
MNESRLASRILKNAIWRKFSAALAALFGALSRARAAKRRVCFKINVRIFENAIDKTGK